MFLFQHVKLKPSVKPYLGGIAILPGDIVSMDIVGVLDTLLCWAENKTIINNKRVNLLNQVRIPEINLLNPVNNWKKIKSYG